MIQRIESERPDPFNTHPTRRAILDLLEQGEQCAGAIASRLEVSRATLSHHLAILLDQRVVQCRQQGAFRVYSLVASAKPVLGRPNAVERIPVETPFARAFKRL